MLRELTWSCVTLPGEDFWKLTQGFLWTLGHAFSLSDLTFSPFAVMSHGYEHNEMLSSVSILRESSNDDCGVWDHLGDLQHRNILNVIHESNREQYTS